MRTRQALTSPIVAVLSGAGVGVGATAIRVSIPAWREDPGRIHREAAPVAGGPGPHLCPAPGGGQGRPPHSAAPDSLRSSPRAALPAAQPDAAGSHLPGLPVAQHEAAHPPHGPRGPVKHTETRTLLSWLPVSVLTSSHPLVLGHSWPTPRPALQHRHGSVSQDSFTQGTPGARSPASPTSTAPPVALRLRRLLAVIPGLWGLGWSLGSGAHSTALHNGPHSLRGLPAAVPYG